MHRVKVGVTTVSEYAYLGSGDVVGTELPQPDVFRPVTWTWTKDLTSDVPFYDVDIAYDESGSFTRTEDNVHTAGAAGSGNGLYDALYTMDNLNRLLRAKEGHWDGTTVTDGNAKRDEVWTPGPDRELGALQAGSGWRSELHVRSGTAGTPHAERGQ